MASFSDDRRAILWKIESNFKQKRILNGHNSDITSLLELSNGIIVTASNDKTLITWDPEKNFSLIEKIEIFNKPYMLVEVYNKQKNLLNLIVVLKSGDIKILTYDVNTKHFNHYKFLEIKLDDENKSIADMKILKNNILAIVSSNSLFLFECNNDFALIAKKQFTEKYAFKSNNNIVTLMQSNVYDNKIPKNVDIIKINQLRDGKLIILTQFHILLIGCINDFKILKKINSLAGTIYTTHTLELENGLIVVTAMDTSIKILDPIKDYNIVLSIDLGISSVKNMKQLKSGLLAIANNSSVFLFDPYKDFKQVWVKDFPRNQITSLIELFSGHLATATHLGDIYVLDRFYNFQLLKNIIQQKNAVTSIIEINKKDSQYYKDILVLADSSFMIFNAKNNYELIKTVDLKPLLISIKKAIQLKNGYILTVSSLQTVSIRDIDNEFNSIFEFSKIIEDEVKNVFELENGLIGVTGFNVNETIHILEFQENKFVPKTKIQGMNIIQLRTLNYLDKNNKIFSLSKGFDKYEQKEFPKNNYKAIKTLNEKNSIFTNKTLYDISNSFNNGTKNYNKTQENIYRAEYEIMRNNSLIDGNIDEHLEFPNIAVVYRKDNSIQIYNIDLNFTLLKTMKIHSDLINNLIELQNGNIASCSQDETILIHSLCFSDNFKKVEVNNLINFTNSHGGEVFNILELNNNILVSSGIDEKIKFWDLSLDKQEFKSLQSIYIKNPVRNFMVTQDNLFIYADFNIIKILKNEYYSSIAVRKKFPSNENGKNVMMNIIGLRPDFSNSMLFATNLEGKGIIFRIKNQEIFSTELSEYPLTIGISLNSSINNLLAISGYDRIIKIIDVNNAINLYIISMLEFHKNVIKDLKEISPDNKLISCGSDGYIAIWDLFDYKLLYYFNTIGYKAISSCLILNQDQIEDTFAQFKDSKDGIFIFHKPKHIEYDIIFSTACEDFRILIWKIKVVKHFFEEINDYYCEIKKELISTNNSHTMKITKLLMLENRRFLSASLDGKIQIFDSKTFELIKTYEFEYEIVGIISIKRNIIAAALMNGSIQILDFEEYKISSGNEFIRSYCCHLGRIISLMYNGINTIISTSVDSTIHWTYFEDMNLKYVYLD